MLDFIYDSLDTVKKLKFPTAKQVAQLTAAIFVLVLVAGAYFILADTVFSGGYKAFYSTMTDGNTPVQPTGITADMPAVTAVEEGVPETPEVVNIETDLPTGTAE